MEQLLKTVLTMKEKPADAVSDTEAVVNPEVEELVMPLLEKLGLTDKLQQVEQLTADREREHQIQQAEALMPGIRDMLPELESEYAKLPDELKPQFQGVAGAVALASLMKQTDKPKTTSAQRKSLKRRTHTEAAPATGRKKKSVSADRVNEMTSEQFARFVESLSDQGSGRSDGEVDPLIR